MKITLRRLKNVFLGLTALIFLNAKPAGVAPENNAAAGTLDAIITIRTATDTPGFIRINNSSLLGLIGLNPIDLTFNFLEQYPTQFPLRTGLDELVVLSNITDVFSPALTTRQVTLQQLFKGVPVFDGALRFHFNNLLDLRSINGVFVKDIDVVEIPDLTPADASFEALSMVARQYDVLPEELEVKGSPTLYIFSKGLAQGFRGSQYLVYEVEVTNYSTIREFMYVDAHNGTLVEQFTGIHGAANRRLYDKTYIPSSPNQNLTWKEGDPLPGSLNTWQKSAIESAGHVYNFFKSSFGRASFDGNDAMMISTHNNPNISCPNATWNGQTANYCDQIATDDVVAHEWAHAYTEHTCGLVYAWQPGALNESFSDIWGETIDMLNGYMDEGETSTTTRTVNSCGTSSRWMIAEKAGPYASAGGLRDMWNPNCRGDPGKVSDSQYHCFSSDGGGVHSNSGVPNHAYALLVDGGTYNGYTISGIGLTKAAHLFWRVQSRYFTKTSDFTDLSEALIAVANELVGVPLPKLKTNSEVREIPLIGAESITPADIESVEKVVKAVELTQNTCGFPPLLEAIDPLCEGANASHALFYEDFESGLSNWTLSQAPVNTQTNSPWVSRDWGIKNNVYGRTGAVAYAPDTVKSTCSVGTSQAGIIRMESPTINIPAGIRGEINLAFDHLIALYESWSGGNIEFSLDNGANWKLIPKEAFEENPYNIAIRKGVLNPMENQMSFTGGNYGEFKSNWGTSVVNLSRIGVASPGTLKLRRKLGTGMCNGVDGWYLDNISVYSCSVTPAVHFVDAESYVTEGQASTSGPECTDYFDTTVSLTIDKAPSQPVSVTLQPDPASTASFGEHGDLMIVGPTTKTLDASNLTANFTVRIFNDAYIEGNETALFNYTFNANGGDAYAASQEQTHSLHIIDDDLEPGNVTDVLLNSDFNKGLDDWRIKSTGTSREKWTYAVYSVALDPAGKPLFIVNSRNAGAVQMNETLESPPFNSVGTKNLKLTFTHYFWVKPSTSNETGVVQVYDGSDWHTLKTFCESGCDTPGTQGSWETPQTVTLDIPEAYNNPNMMIRFNYKANNDYYWAIDNILVTSTNSTVIQSAVNAGIGDSQYLGPNEAVAFHDPATGNLLIKIENLSDHDYGCTTVEVDRAGANETDWFNDGIKTLKITNKTFRVIPTHNNRDGHYRITLFYTAEELSSFLGSITSIGKTEVGISSANRTNSSAEYGITRTAFDSDHAFSAEFTTGFSGFGLSDSEPMIALPVKLTGFKGESTAEGNLLSWQTSSEQNSEYFLIERSGNQTSFETIGRVNSAGYSSSLLNYSFLDNKYTSGLTYYRLKQVDKDGQFAYSRIISVKSQTNNILDFGPNPVSGTLAVRLPASASKNIMLSVVNQAGQTVIRPTSKIVQNGSIQQDVSHLPTGVYQVIIEEPAARSVFTIVKL